MLALYKIYLMVQIRSVHFVSTYLHSVLRMNVLFQDVIQVNTVFESDQNIRRSNSKSWSSCICRANLVPNTAACNSSLGIDIC